MKTALYNELMVFLRKRSLLLVKCNADDFLVQSAYNRKRTKKNKI